MPRFIEIELPPERILKVDRKNGRILLAVDESAGREQARVRLCVQTQDERGRPRKELNRINSKSLVARERAVLLSN